MGDIYRRQMIEGVTIPGIIHNENYFFNWLGVYEDGVVSCWKKSDLRQFREELRKGWVVTSVPAGGELSIFELGSYRVEEAVEGALPARREKNIHN